MYSILPKPVVAIAFGRLAMLLFALVCARVAEAQAPNRLVPIREARVDADGNYVPDRLGDTITVAGRASVGTGMLSEDRLQVFLQEDSVGIQLFSRHLGQAIVLGDSIVATGTVGQYNGLTSLQVLDYRVIDSPLHPPRPLDISFTEAVGEPFEGSFVRLSGHIVNKGSNKGGQYLLLTQPGESEDLLAVYVYNHQLGHINLDGYEVGDEIRVSGVLGQYDYADVPNGRYQVYVRSANDLQTIGLTRRSLYTAAGALSFVLLLSAIGLFLLRVQVRRRTRELSESEARFRQLADATAEGVVIYEAGLVLDVNRSMLTLSGLTYEEVTGRPLDHLGVHCLSVTPLERMPQAGGEPVESVMLLPDGKEIPVEVRTASLAYDGREVHVASIRDITEQKRVESALRTAMQEAEEVARLKTSMLNNINHELRTPLTGILGFAELVVTEAGGPIREYGELILQTGNRLLDTINSVLDMAAIEAGSMPIVPEVVNVTDLVREVVVLQGPEAVKKQVALAWSANSGDVVMWTSAPALYRILSNLVRNAVKFTDEGSVDVVVEPAEGGVRIHVKDTGIGIEPSFLPHLFGEFTQESAGVSRRYQGSGLGLAITSKLVHLLGGELSVRSEKGCGSVFTILLPNMAALEIDGARPAPRSTLGPDKDHPVERGPSAPRVMTYSTRRD